MSRHVLPWFGAAFAGLLLALLPQVAGACPYSCTLQMCAQPPTGQYRDTVYISTAPALAMSVNCTVCPLVGIQCEGWPQAPHETLGYDIPAGTVNASVTVFDTFGQARPITVTSDDQYWIVGPVTGSPVTCSANFAVSGYGNCRSTGATTITVQGQTATRSFANDFSIGPCNVPPPISGVISLPVSALVGEPFELQLAGTVNMISLGTASVAGTLSFSGLPAGYAVVSCNGFGAGATPALRRTWGSVKGAYR